MALLKTNTLRVFFLSLIVSRTFSCLTMDSTPSYPYATNWYTASSLISDGLSTISVIQVYYFKTTTYLYSLQVTDSNNVLKGTKVPSYSAAQGALVQTITVTPPALLKTYKVWTKNVASICGCTSCLMITQMEFIFSDGTSQIVTTPNFLSTNTLYTFAASANKQIVGFYSRTDTGCQGTETELQVYYRYLTCAQAVTVSLTTMNDQTMNIFTGLAQNYAIDTTTNFCGLTCTGQKFLLTVTGPNPSLITIPVATTASIVFAASNNLADAGTYTISVVAQYDQDSAGIWSTAGTAIYNYANCGSVTILDTCPSSYAVTVGYPAYIQPIWTDSVSNAINNGKIICVQVVSYFVSDAPSTAANSTMHSKFDLTVSAPYYARITASPTSCDEVGEYQLTTNQYMRDNPSSTATCTVGVYVNYAVQIVQASTNTILQTMNWVISFNTSFTYQLAVLLSSTCNFPATSWTLTTTSTNNPTRVNNFQTIDSTGLFSTGPFPNVLTAGTYKISVTAVTLNGKSYASIINSPTSPGYFTLNVINPCWLTTLTYTSSVGAMSCSVLQAASCTQQIPQTFNDALSSSQSQTLSICGGLSYLIGDSPAIGVTALTAAELQVSTTGLITVSATTASKVGIHTVTVLTRLAAYSNVTSSQTFTLTITPCILTSVKVVSAAGLVDLSAQTYNLGSSSTLSYPFSTIQTPACAYIASSWQVTSTPVTGINPNPFNVISTSGVYAIAATTQNSYSGTYTIAISAIILNGVDWSGQLISPSQFTLTVLSPCVSTIVTAASIPPITLHVFQGSATTTYNNFATFSDSVSTANSSPGMCQMSYSYSITTNAGGFSLTTFSLDTVSQSFNIYSSNMNQIGNYTVTLNGFVTLYPSRIATTTFIVTIADPCNVSIVNAPTAALTPMNTSVLIQDSSGNPYYLEKTPSIFTDSASLLYGSGSGIDFCGLRTYSISSTPIAPATSLTPTELSIDPLTGLIKIYTDSTTKIGAHNAVITVTLASYPSATSATQSFQVNIQPCIITSFDSVTLTTEHYSLKETAFTWNLISMSLTTQVPACGYSVTSIIDSSTVPNFVNVTMGSIIQFTAYSTSILAVGTHEMKIINTIIGYNPLSPAPTCQSIQTLIVEDPCGGSLINGPTIVQNFTQFAGYSLASNSTYTFYDVLSQSLRLPTDTYDYCGEKSFIFTINSTLTTLLTGNNSEMIVFQPPKQTSIFGVQAAILTVCLEQYPYNCKNLSFQVTTLGSKPPIIQNQAYSIGNQVLKIQVGAFAVLPTTYANSKNLTSSITIYLLAPGISLPSQISLNNSGLTNIQNFTWIQYDNQANFISVFTNDQTIQGNYTVVVVQSFGKSFANVNPYVTFNLAITYTPLVVELTPVKSTDFFMYWIGYQNPYVDLLKYYNVSLTSNYKITMNATQISGLKLEDPVQIDSNYKLIVPVNDITLNGQSVQFQIFATTNLPNQISNANLILTFNFKIFQNSSLNNGTQNEGSNKTSQQVITEQKLSFLFKDKTLPKKKPSLANLKGFNPAFIQSINQFGLVKIRFFSSIFVPEFSISTQNEYNTSQTRLLEQQKYSLQVQQFIDSNTLHVMQQSYQGTKELNWTCLYLTKDILTIQLEFQNPLEVSSVNQDLLIVKFVQPDLFVLHNMQDYLFTNIVQQKIFFGLPQQFPSKSTQATFETISAQVNKMSTTALIITLIMQIVAKKIIGSMYVYFCVLQILLLVNLNGKLLAPASAELILKEVSGIINLSKFDKQSIGDKLKIPPTLFQPNSLLSNLGGIAILALAILLFLLVFVLLARYLKTKKGQNLIQAVKNFFFWNFLIRYFQIALINFNYSAIKSIQKAASIQEVTISSIILVIVYSIVLFMCYILLAKPFDYLAVEETRKKIGNLYQNLNCYYRENLAYGALFFIQRLLVVVVIAVDMSYGVQWFSVYLIVFMNAVYLFYVKPFLQWSDARVEYLNVVLLWLTQICQVAISTYNTDTQVRFECGIYFDVVFCFGILLNILYILSLSFYQFKLKCMQLSYRRKARQDMLQKQNKQKQAIQKHIDNIEKARRLKEELKKQIELNQQNFDQQQSKKPIPLPALKNTQKIDRESNKDQKQLNLNQKHQSGQIAPVVQNLQRNYPMKTIKHKNSNNLQVLNQMSDEHTQSFAEKILVQNSSYNSYANKIKLKDFDNS